MIANIISPPPEHQAGPAPTPPPAVPTEPVAEATPAIPKPLADRIKASLSDSGPGFFSAQPAIPSEDITDFSFDTSNNDLQLTINVGEFWNINGAGIRNHLMRPLGTFRRLVDKFPQIKRIHATLQAPAAEQRDEHGNVINPGAMALFVALDIDCRDFKKYPKDFDWGSYPVYVANRYSSMSNINYQDIWNTELRDEVQLGGFSIPQ